RTADTALNYDLSLYYGYASGDRNPDDRESNRFERFFGFWLASDTDRWNNLLAGSSFNRDSSGKSGDQVGHGFDGRVRFRLGEHVESTVGYSHFTTGDFVRARQLAATGQRATE